MKPRYEMLDVFAAYGRAAYYAQLLEYDLVSIWMLDSIAQGVSVTRKDLVQFQANWSKNTLGKLLHPLKKSSLLPNDLKQFLEDLRKTRNTLAHDFFLTVATDLRTSRGREHGVAEMKRITSVLTKGHELFRNVLDAYGKDFDIDFAGILRKLLNETACDAK
ncbi:MAG: hypothetical protein KAV00_08640 [Phycisphaerae bacterium]|nr:hypothetical protein [Phycisphaerae bacterium]